MESVYGPWMDNYRFGLGVKDTRVKLSDSNFKFLKYKSDEIKNKVNQFVIFPSLLLKV